MPIQTDAEKNRILAIARELKKQSLEQAQKRIQISQQSAEQAKQQLQHVEHEQVRTQDAIAQVAPTVEQLAQSVAHMRAFDNNVRDLLREVIGDCGFDNPEFQQIVKDALVQHCSGYLVLDELTTTEIRTRSYKVLGWKVEGQFKTEAILDKLKVFFCNRVAYIFGKERYTFFHEHHQRVRPGEVNPVEGASLEEVKQTIGEAFRSAYQTTFPELIPIENPFPANSIRRN